jgi:putative nucleotidyltransferase with HDIG domain
MKMLDHIVVHSFQVCRVATFIVDQMDTAQVQLSRNLIQAAALLHDITKTRSFTTRENHALTGAQFLSDLGYPEVGHIVEQHVRLEDYFDSDLPNEAEIVNYADKRVLHDKVVSLKERMEYILEKYAQGPEYKQRVRWLWQKTENLESRLFRYISFAPQELSHHLDSAINFDDLLSNFNIRSPH